ncbi:MAG: DUF4367 domain-containing protein [Candidatus Viridilinea halotolerans]|uniref:DUF4367 domain-containing protein n=1 Tax=Candidatus Viridilinea halotolerans TaxID=2491704 RepID=A0A426TRB2_9CHLR|nr:MAG: DUF4367 domain-containing protein [Candidatus Viridilinea halotolerans]
MRRITALLLMVLATLSLAACTQSVPTAEEIVSRMEAARATTTSVAGTVDVRFQSPEQNGTLTLQGWMEQTGTTDAAGHPIARMRVEVAAASEAKLLGMTLVSNGESFWLYNPSENTVVTGVISEMKGATQSVRTETPPMLNDIVAQGLDALDLTVLGMEQVAGQDTWKVSVAPNAETSARLALPSAVQGTLWVHEELALPLKFELDASDFGQGSIEVSNLVVNEPIDAARFTFAIPEGATVVQAAEIIAKLQEQNAASLEEARTGVSFGLREPTYLPDGVSLIEVRVMGTSTVIMNYVGEAMSLSIVQSNEDVGNDREPPLNSNVAEVTVNGLPATLITSAEGQASMLRWEENGVRYIIAGPLSASEALQVAEGLR